MNAVKREPSWVQMMTSAYDQQKELQSRPENKRVEVGIAAGKIVFTCHVH